MRAVIVRVLRLGKLAEAGPLEAQRQHAPLRKIDAALLLVFRRFAQLIMPVNIQDGRNASADLLWLIEDSGGLVSRNDFVAQAAQAVSVARLQDSHVLDL